MVSINYLHLPGGNDAHFNQMVLDSLSKSIWITVRDKTGQFVYASERFLTTLGIEPEYLAHKGSDELIAENFYEPSSSVKAFQTGENTKEFFRGLNGELVYSESEVIRDSEGNIEYVITQCSTPQEVLAELGKLRNDLERSEKETSQLRDILMKSGNDLVYQSPQMHHLVQRAMKVAVKDVSILLTGESGVGKEVVAKAVHSNSPRKDKAFVPVCIPLMAPSLLESELFGYADGAFTGASRSGRMGLFETADGGTVFLDEVGDIPLDLQVKLLRVLENREIYRVGSTRGKKLDIRVISATNRDLKQMVRQGTFREDLLYRLSIVHLNIPPLREREKDIQALTQYFMDELNKSYGMRKTLSEEVVDVFCTHDWPGNVRELRNVLEKLMILTEDNHITAQAMYDTLQEESGYTLYHASSAPSERKESAVLATKDNIGITISEEYQQIDRKRILDALIQTGGNRKEAAKLLGISRTKLYRKLNELG